MKLFKYIGITSLLLFSFYYTEKLSNVVINNSDLVLEIKDHSDEFNIEPVSAIIDNEYITPGINGSNVNVLKSYNNMKFLNEFNAYYLVFDIIKPEISLENNLDKIIKNGNKSKEGVSIIIVNNEEVINYSNEKNINITRLISLDTFNKSALYEQVNIDDINYKKVDRMLKNNNLDKNICFINDNLIEYCREDKKYLVINNKELNNYNLSEVKNNIVSGDIILIKDNVNITNYKILIKQIYYQNLKILSLSDLISE